MFKKSMGEGLERGGNPVLKGLLPSGGRALQSGVYSSFLAGHQSPALCYRKLELVFCSRSWAVLSPQFENLTSILDCVSCSWVFSFIILEVYVDILGSPPSNQEFGILLLSSLQACVKKLFYILYQIKVGSRSPHDGGGSLLRGVIEWKLNWFMNTPQKIVLILDESSSSHPCPPGEDSPPWPASKVGVWFYCRMWQSPYTFKLILLEVETVQH